MEVRKEVIKMEGGKEGRRKLVSNERRLYVETFEACISLLACRKRYLPDRRRGFVRRATASPLNNTAE